VCRYSTQEHGRADASNICMCIARIEHTRIIGIHANLAIGSLSNEYASSQRLMHGSPCDGAFFFLQMHNRPLASADSNSALLTAGAKCRCVIDASCGVCKSVWLAGRLGVINRIACTLLDTRTSLSLPLLDCTMRATTPTNKTNQPTNNLNQ
jgi:hypothetical protein